MVPSKELFELIKSMNKMEKGYFKKSTHLYSIGGKNNYLILFDVIAKQKVYDEDKLIEQLQEHKFIRHLPYWKNYLYTRILDALENYHRELSVNVKIRSAINRAEILQARGLYSHSARLVKKTKLAAEGSEAHPALMDIYSTLEFRQYTEKYDHKSLETIYTKTEKSYVAFRQNLLSRNLHTNMIHCYHLYYQTRNKKYLAEAKQLIESPFLKEIPNSGTFTGIVRYFGINYFYWYLRNNLDKAYAYEKKILDLFLEDPKQIKSFSKAYIATVNNLFVISTEQKKYTVAQTHLHELRAAEVFAKTHSQKAVFYYVYNTNLLHYLCRTGNTSELSRVLSTTFSNYKLYEEELSNYETIELFMHISISYYCLGNLKKCIVFLNKLRNEYNLSEHPDIEPFFHLFYSIMHYDAGNYEILSSALQVFHRFLKKKENISTVESSVIRFLRRQLNLNSQPIEEFKKFKKILDNSKNNLTDKYIFKYVDLSVWLQTKIENKTFPELMKEK